MDNRPIGVYDSGMGGITLWRAIRDSLPNESLVYLGDGENCPYGDKSSEEVATLALKAVEILVQCDCKMVVVACNTATTAAITKLRALYPDLPFVGMEPAIKPACRETKSGVVAVLATKRSLESALFADTLARYATGIEVIKQVGEGFVEIVENGLEECRDTYNIIKSMVDIMVGKSVDKIVLGCTHYPFLIPQFKKAINGRAIDIIEPSPAIVNRIEDLLTRFNMLSEEGNIIKDKFITFADEEYRNKLILKAKGRL